jgi:hypothetical protein
MPHVRHDAVNLKAHDIARASLSRAGVDLSAHVGPLTVLPAGVTGVVEWANRLLVVAYMLWVVLAAIPILRDSLHWTSLHRDEPVHVAFLRQR